MSRIVLQRWIPALAKTLFSVPNLATVFPTARRMSLRVRVSHALMGMTDSAYIQFTMHKMRGQEFIFQHDEQTDSQSCYRRNSSGHHLPIFQSLCFVSL